MILSDKNVLVIGDCFVGDKFNFNLLKPHEKPNYFRIVAQPFADLEITIRLADETLSNSPNIDVIVLFPFTWEFLEAELYPRGNAIKYISIKELLRHSLPEIINIIERTTNIWKAKYPHLLVCWCTGFPPDFLTYNNTVAGAFPDGPTKFDVGRSETMAKEFYSLTRELVITWMREIPFIHLLDMNNCFFMNENYLENSFLKTNFSDVYFPKFCTIDGLIPSQKLIHQFFIVFEDRIYPYLRNLFSDNHSSYENQSVVSPLNNPEYIRPRVVIDYQHSKSNADPLSCNPNNAFNQPPNHPSSQNSLSMSQFLSQHDFSNGNELEQNRSGSTLLEGKSHMTPLLQNAKKESQTQGPNELKEMISPSLNDLPTGLLNTLKSAINFLNEKEKKGEVIIPQNEDNPSPYKENLQSLFNPSHWRDLFLKGNKSEAINCLHFCINAVLASPEKKGLKIIMVVSSQELVYKIEQNLCKLVEKNEIGINDHIPFGSPIILVDNPSNLRLRLSQSKFRNFTSPIALLVFGDDLLANKTPANIEFVYFIKSILNRKGEFYKVVISETGSTEAEIVAQNAFSTSFHVPRNRMIESKESSPSVKVIEEKQDPVNVDERRGISSCLSEMLNEKTASPGKKKEEEKELSLSPHSKKKSASLDRKKKSRDEDEEKAKDGSKLESILKMAQVSLSYEEKKEIEEHDQKFITFLDPMGRSYENEFLKIGERAVREHESDYKAYKEVPDLHPEYEEKYECFINKFEELYGKDTNPQYLQTTWKHFWERLIRNLQEMEWKMKKRDLQKSFMEKYQRKRDEIMAAKKKVQERKKSKHGKNGEPSRSDRRKLDEAKKTERSDKKEEKPESKRKRDTNTDGKSSHKRSSSPTSKSEDIVFIKKVKSSSNPSPPSSIPLPHSNIEAKPIFHKPEEIERASNSNIEKPSIKDATDLSKKTELKTTSTPLVHDLATPVSMTQMGAKEGPPKSNNGSKPKIIFNLSVPKSREQPSTSFSLSNCLRHLKLVSGKIGMMGHALRTVVDQSQKLLPNTYEAFKVFTDKDSELLVNISINKLKALLNSCSEAEAKVYQKTISFSQRLLEEAKLEMKKSTSKTSSANQGSSEGSHIDIEAIAKATIGFNTEATYKFIRMTFLYKGLKEPSQGELDKIFTEVSARHFKIAMNE